MPTPSISTSRSLWRATRKSRPANQEARERVAESARLFDSTRDDIFRSIRRLAVQGLALEQQLEIYRKDIVPRAEQTLRVSMADYRTGKVDALQVIDNYNQVLRFRLQFVRLEAILGQTFASLERAVGTQLTKLPGMPHPNVTTPQPRARP